MSASSLMKAVNTQHADELAAWHSIQLDLKRVIVWLDTLVAELGQDDNPPKFPPKGSVSIWLEGLWVAALVFYTRCFNGGKRASLNKDIFAGLPGEPIEAHEWYIAMRNRHIAHSVNSYEQYKTGMFVQKTGDQFKVTGVGPFSMSHSYPTIDGCKTLLELAKTSCNHATSRVRDLKQIVESEVKQLTNDELKKARALRLKVPRPKQADQARIYS